MDAAQKSRNLDTLNCRELWKAPDVESNGFDKTLSDLRAAKTTQTGVVTT